MHRYNWIIGATPQLDHVHALWKKNHPNVEVIKIHIDQDENLNFDFSPLDHIDPLAGTGFIVFDESFGNFRRSELMQATMERGIKLTNFISPLASIPDSTKLGINIFIGEYVTIGSHCRIDFNTFILPGSHIGNNVHIKSSCWIARGVIIADKVEIGKHSTLRTGTSILDNIKIGNQCDLGWNKIYDTDINDKSFYHIEFDEVINVHDN